MNPPPDPDLGPWAVAGIILLASVTALAWSAVWYRIWSYPVAPKVFEPLKLPPPAKPVMWTTKTTTTTTYKPTETPND